MYVTKRVPGLSSFQSFCERHLLPEQRSQSHRSVMHRLRNQTRNQINEIKHVTEGDATKAAYASQWDTGPGSRSPQRNTCIPPPRHGDPIVANAPPQLWMFVSEIADTCFHSQGSAQTAAPRAKQHDWPKQLLLGKMLMRLAKRTTTATAMYQCARIGRLRQVPLGSRYMNTTVASVRSTSNTLWCLISTRPSTLSAAESCTPRGVSGEPPCA